MGLLSLAMSALGYLKKVPPTLYVVAAFFLLMFYANNRRERVNELENAPVKRDTSWFARDVDLKPPPVIPSIKGHSQTIDPRLTDSLLAELISSEGNVERLRGIISSFSSPFDIEQTMEIQDEEKSTGVSFDMSFTAHPVTQSVTNLEFKNVRVNFVEREIAETKTIQEEQPFITLGADFDSYGYWNDPFFKNNIFEVLPWIAINPSKHVAIEFVPMGVIIQHEPKLAHKINLRLTL